MCWKSTTDNCSRNSQFVKLSTIIVAVKKLNFLWSFMEDVWELKLWRIKFPIILFLNIFSFTISSLYFLSLRAFIPEIFSKDWKILKLGSSTLSEGIDWRTIGLLRFMYLSISQIWSRFPSSLSAKKDWPMKVYFMRYWNGRWIHKFHYLIFPWKIIHHSNKEIYIFFYFIVWIL